jgi:uncharacterized repeat protein (TIGR03803 family)
MRNFKIILLALNLLVVVLAAAPWAHGQIQGVDFNTLAVFSKTNNGAFPWSPPVLGADGNLYGTLPGGGTNNVGVIYKVSTNATQTTLYTFNTNNGANPIASLVSGRDGNLYGVALNGGTNNNSGTIFELTTNGAFTLLYSFGMMTNNVGSALDGSNPYGGLVQGRDGNFYGVTYSGGVSNVGTVFQFSTNGTLTTLHSFTGDGTNDDGAHPHLAPLVEGADGVFYGTTLSGGTNNAGTIFQITADGALTNLFEFNNTNGLNPYGGLNFGTDGNLYGTTGSGGAHDYGTAFQITTNGVLTTLFQFGGADGLHSPLGGVVPGNNNTLFGTTYGGGTQNYGAVFQLTTNGLLTTLLSFAGTNGADCYAGVIRSAGGNFYGAAYRGGGQGGYGTVYSLNFSMLVSFISPTANGFWSNDVLTVTGTASDNAPGRAIANVLYSLNSAAWTNPTTTNNWVSWTSNVMPAPGTNTLQAYAMDDVGNVSATNTVRFVYVPSATLTVLTNGSGTISPNYNGALLQIGKSYSMTATAATGVIFTNWTGGANLPLTVVTNKTTVQFLMVSNLTLQANFVDVTRPTLSITNVTAGMNVSNAAFTVKGIAGDSAAVANVFYSLNNAIWSNAATTNNWTNWSAAVTLIPGTNTVAAYSVDTSGNLSPTNRVSFQYVVTNLLQIQAIGLGTLSPNYSNAWLQIGKSYAITATAGTGFAFTNWTGGTSLPLSVITNGTTVQFMMASNLMLQANFVDVARPTLSITNVTAGMNVSNAAFTVKGIAGDNVTVASVLYSLNNTGWSNALTSNNWTNWSGAVTLLPGTNTIAAYAVDTSGNASITNTLKFVYVVTNQLQVSVAGLGSVSPNYSNAWLVVGRSYSLTATPASGFKFTNWTGGTSLPLSVITNGATVQFLMASNLTLQANFVDVTRPTLSITNLTAGQRWSNAVFTVRGTAGDNWQVSNVWYQLNGSEWSNAATANAWTNWSALLNLTPGTNSLQAYAVDSSGNVSLTNKVNFQYVVTNQLQVSVTGLGTISPNYSNAWLEIGRNYSMIATPATGFKFTNWTGGLITNTATLNFVMASNLTLVANFIDTNRPVLSITNLTAGQRWSNAVFTVRGTAGDNWQVGNVWYQLNGSEWSNAMTANAWTNWSALLNLTPGTNSLQAYAVDTSGNVSLTNELNFQYVVTNQLQVLTVGLGTIKPNYSNAWLEIGRNYSITSAPASGFVFTNWLISTNGISGAPVTGTNLQFMMVSNLMLQANFVDVARPTLIITAPTSGQKMTNALVTVIGTAADNWQVGGVWYQLNGGAWNPGMTTNSYTNWTSPLLTLEAGTNSVNAYASDVAGNLSTTNRVSIVSSNAFLLQLSFALTPPLTSAGLNFSLQLSPGLNGHVQVSTNLATWTALTNFVGTNTILNFLDPEATHSSHRFYRAVIP